MPAPIHPTDPNPTIILYGKPGCGLCEETREFLETLMAERRSAGRSVSPIEDRDITTDDRWFAAHAEEIPVLEIAGRQLRLATSGAAIRRFVTEGLGG
ncbi:MAG: glutaredoxin family protein [Chloroflexi bacterium]|nr:glutaredoxin family protein [Chloroflexota bacterium]